MNTQEAILRLKKCGLTQNEIASAVGCSAANISQIMLKKGGHINPSAKIVNGLMQLLKENGLI